MYTRVIVPLDGSPLAAILEEAELTSADALEYLAPLAGELWRRGIRVRTEVRRGEPVDEIVDCARAVGADLIAMTTHGRTGLGRWLFGSVAEAARPALL
jgi:nucleotide-binding universal stress UspA family protein